MVGCRRGEVVVSPSDRLLICRSHHRTFTMVMAVAVVVAVVLAVARPSVVLVVAMFTVHVAYGQVKIIQVILVVCRQRCGAQAHARS